MHQKLNKKKVRIIPVIIIISLFLIIFVYFSTIFSEANLVIWIQNYDPICDESNITCFERAYKFDVVTIDGKKIGGAQVIVGGEIWKKEITLQSGKHDLKFIQKDEMGNAKTTWGFKIELVSGEKKCFEQAHFTYNESNPGYLSSDRCP